MGKKRVLSGMRPTGKLHLGHLVGALDSWVRLQDQYECFYMSADWHALMSEYADPSEIKGLIRDNIIDWISCGVDPEKSTIFVQSQVPEHAELHLLLSMIVPLGWLQRCPTYKEQLKELSQRDLNTYAFLGYPVLQSADILLYKAEAVPVGNDQLPHLELTREIARRFNQMYEAIFIEPAPILTDTPRLLGIDNRKMSNSYNNFITLADGPKVVAEKTQQMITDPQRIKLSDPGHPEVCNVYSYYEVFSEEATDEVSNWCRNAKVGCTECKKRLADVLTTRLRDIQTKRRELLNDRNLIDSILRKGNEVAGQIAKATMRQAKDAVGL